jgi:formamidopyrimidine-DNA glycosylase
MVGARIAQWSLRRLGLRFPPPRAFAERLAGQAVTDLTRRAKYPPRSPVVRRGAGPAPRHDGPLSRGSRGRNDRPRRLLRGSGANAGAHDHVVLHLSNGAVVTYNDVRRFGFMDLVPATGSTCRHFAGMGMEPLGGELSGEAIARLFRGRRAPAQGRAARPAARRGPGQHLRLRGPVPGGLHPGAPAARSPRLGRADEAAHRLAAHRRGADGGGGGGGSTLRDYARTDGSLGLLPAPLPGLRPGGDACVSRDCAGTVERLVQSGRSTFFCPSCQG